MAKQYRTALIIEGDASGGIKAIQATEKELGELNRRFDTGGKRAKKFAQDVDGTSRELEFLKNSAMSVGAALAGAFAVNNIAGQATMIQQTDALAQSLSVSTQTLQQWQYAGQKVRLEADKVGDIFKDVSDKIGDFAETGGGEAADLFENLNLNIRELQSLSPDQQILKIADAVNQLEDPSQRTFYFESLADEMVRLQPLLANGAQGLRDAAAEADALGVAMSEMDIHRAVEAAHAMEQLQGVATGLSNTLIADLGPGLAQNTSALIDWIEAAGGADDVLQDVATIAGTLATVYLARRLGPGLLSVGKTGLAAGRTIAQGMVIATGASGRLNQALVLTQGRIAATAAAGRGLSAAMGLLGGPAGVAILAAGALYTYHEELDAMLAPAQRATQRVNDLTNAINLNSESAIKAQLVNLTAEMVKLEQQATSAKKRLDEIKESSNDYGPQQNSMVLGQDADERRAAYETLQKTREQLDANGQASEKLRSRLQQLSDQGVETVNTVSDLGTANDDAATAAEKFDDSLLSLLDRIDPLAKSQREFTRDNAALQTALLSGRITTEEYFESIEQLEQSYRNASSAAEVYGLTGEQANQRVEESVDPMVTAVERGIERLDDSFADAWRGLLDGSEDAFSSFKNIALDTLAEVIHAYTTRQITASLGATFGVAGQAGSGGQSSGAGSMQMPSTTNLGSAWNTAQNAYAGYTGTYGAALGTQGGVSGQAIGSANAVANGTGAQGAWNAAAGGAGGAAGGTSLGLTNYGSGGGYAGGLANMGAGMAAAYAGGYVGDQVSGAVSDKQANSNYGQTAGAAIGSIWGPLGTAAGAAIGSVVDTVFGSSSQELDLALVRGENETSHNWDHGIHANSALGSVGFQDEGSHDLLDVWDKEGAQKLIDGIATLDNVLGGLADTPEQLQEMQDAVLASNRHGIEGHYGETSNPGDVVGGLTSRYKDAIDVLDLATEDFLLSFEGKAQDLVSITSNLGNFEDLVGDNATAMADMRAAIADTDDIVATTQELLAQAQAMNTLSAMAADLNLTFDETASGALAASSNLAELAGGLDNLNALNQQYFDAFYTEQEKFERLSDSLSDQFSEIGATLPETREGVRSLVEGLDLMTESGREQYAAIMQLVPSLKEYTQGIREHEHAIQSQLMSSLGVSDAVSESLDAYNAQIDSINEMASAREAQLKSEMQAVETLGGLIDSLMLSNQSILDPAERLQEAQRQFAELQVRAESGDTDAVSQLQGASSTYLDAAASYYGQSSSQYASIFDDVTSGVENLEDRFGDSVASLGSIESIEQQALREQQHARDLLTSQLSEQVEMVDSLASLADLFAALPSDLANALSGIIPGIEESGTAVGGSLNDRFGQASQKYLADNPDVAAAVENGVFDSAYDHYLQYGRYEDTRDGFPEFATGGAFTSGVVDRPTKFDMGVMGEAGPEAIMPLSNVGGSLGVNVSGAVDLEPLTRELYELRREVAQLRAERSGDAAAARQQRGEQLRAQQGIRKNTRTRAVTV
ncbi:hypothetical protein HLV40_15155 [Chromohalobacter salexigens]|nr:hypothetical protein [Chromohalobacter salexigens]